MPNANRLPETRSLAEILPKGREGGLEFARIVDLLLFHEARRRGRFITLFSDRAGDYQGLDSFEDAICRIYSGRIRLPIASLSLVRVFGCPNFRQLPGQI